MESHIWLTSHFGQRTAVQGPMTQHMESIGDITQSSHLNTEPMQTIPDLFGPLTPQTLQSHSWLASGNYQAKEHSRMVPSMTTTGSQEGTSTAHTTVILGTMDTCTGHITTLVHGLLTMGPFGKIWFGKMVSHNRN